MPLNSVQERQLKGYQSHGFETEGEADGEWIGYCPLSDKSGKFFLNQKTLLWHSKTAGRGGNFIQFLNEISERNVGRFAGGAAKRLSRLRGGFDSTAFSDYHCGWNGSFYTVPVRDETGKLVDLRRWSPKTRKMMSTPGCTTGLMGHERLKRSDPSETIYLCEGEWDAMALAWLLKKVGESGVVLGAPGAGIFKASWIESFRGRNVVVLYDNDAAGESGETRVYDALHHTAKALRFVHWLPTLSSGFDVRDWIKNGAVEKGKPEGCLTALKAQLKSTPRSLGKREVTDDEEDGPVRRASSYSPDHPPDLPALIEVYQKWLQLEDTSIIKVCLAVVLSQELPGDPVWLFLVGPPGGAKSEILSSLAEDPKTYHLSSLTPHSLISGAQTNKDPSLIPKLDGKTLILKDFTSIMSMNEGDKNEIFGLLRDAYDGYCAKTFGTGVTRSYTSRFTVLGGVTPAIYSLSHQHQSLGERFLKFLAGHNLEHLGEDDIIRRAIGNVTQETEMREELRDVACAFLDGRRRDLVTPALGEIVREKVLSIAKLCARLRGVVDRDFYNNNIMTGRPSAEIATRLGKQLVKFGMSLALVEGHDVVGEDEYVTLKKCAIDTIPQRREDLLRCLWLGCPSEDDALKTRQIAEQTRYPLTTVQRLLEDLQVLNVVQRTGTIGAAYWALTPYIRDLVAKSGLYATVEEVNRPLRRVFRRLKVRKRVTTRPADRR